MKGTFKRKVKEQTRARESQKSSHHIFENYIKTAEDKSLINQKSYPKLVFKHPVKCTSHNNEQWEEVMDQSP